jgi:hypothetical protein
MTAERSHAGDSTLRENLILQPFALFTSRARLNRLHVWRGHFAYVGLLQFEWEDEMRTK